MHTIVYVLQASGILTTGQLDILTLFIGAVRKKDVLLMNVLNKRIRKREPLTGRNFQSRSNMGCETLVGINP